MPSSPMRSRDIWLRHGLSAHRATMHMTGCVILVALHIFLNISLASTHPRHTLSGCTRRTTVHALTSERAGLSAHLLSVSSISLQVLLQFGLSISPGRSVHRWARYWKSAHGQRVHEEGHYVLLMPSNVVESIPRDEYLKLVVDLEMQMFASCCQ